jgi:peroxiredoxin
MKKYLAMLSIVIFAVFILTASSKDNAKKIPSVKIKDIAGKIVDTGLLNNKGKPMVISFWATWCKPCIQELANIHEVYEDWQAQTGIKMIAVSIDDSRNSKKVAPFVKGRDWKFDVLIDENSDFKRAMNVNNPPHTFLINGEGEIVYQHNGYAPGDEKKLYEEIKKLIK